MVAEGESPPRPLLANDRPIDVEALDGSYNTTDIFPRDDTSSRKRPRT